MEILTSPQARPSRDWLAHVRTARARHKIRQWVKQEEHERSVALGREILDREIRRRRLTAPAPDRYAQAALTLSVGAREQLEAAVGRGDVPLGQVMRALYPDLAPDDLLQLMHLEPIEDARLDRLDQIGGLELRVVERVAADEGGTLEDDVVELTAAAVVRADRADERAGAQPLATQHRIARRGRGDDDVARGRVLVALSRLGTVLLAEGAQALLGPAVGDHAFELR